MHIKSTVSKILSWKIRNISNRNFLLILSVLVGIAAGLASAILKVSSHYIEHLLHVDENMQQKNYLFFLYPLIGIVLTVLFVEFLNKGKLGRGIGGIIYSIFKKSSHVEKDKMYSHMVTGILTVGFGGSVGLEAPIVVTGAALGSNIASFFHLNYKERTLLLACGAGAGISAIFNSPIAGVLFAVEVLLSEISIPAFIPLLISAATASVVSKALYGGQLFFLITEGWNLHAIPYYVLLGIFTGLLSVYVTRMTLYTEGLFESKESIYRKAIIGGLLLGIMIFLLPPLYGEGYNTVEILLEGRFTRLLDNSIFYQFNNSQWIILLVAGAIAAVKVFATSITIGAGGNGGIFAPSLFMGAVVGFFYAHAINFFSDANLTEANFIAVGMAGIMSGVIHTPLTAIFLIAEVTGGYALFVPLMIVSALSFMIVRYFEPYSIYTKLLAKKGHLPSKDKDKTVLNQMDLKDMIETDFMPITSGMSLGEFVESIAHSRRNIFPVLNKEKELIGIVSLDHIREIMFKRDKYDKVHVKNMMSQPPTVIDVNEEMPNVMKKFEDYHAWNLPVVENGKYVGFVSKSNIFTQYRNLLILQSENVE